VADYFASDIHLRLDRPQRGLKFGRWVDELEGSDNLTIVGDLCDFWMASRQYPLNPNVCAGLKSLIAFRARGGTLTIVPGNHDQALRRDFATVLDARCIEEPSVEWVIHGMRVLVAHGHRLRAPAQWKRMMESDAFLQAFRSLPNPVAHVLERTLDINNERKRKKAEDRQIACYREYADTLGGSKDLIIFGHVHRFVDDQSRSPRLVVLGDWIEGASYLKIDAGGAYSVRNAALPIAQRQS
jgi:UDP-2,3-diacylglucosamine hydrolase